MSSLIEQAAKRLEQLRRAGAEIPEEIQGMTRRNEASALGKVSFSSSGSGFSRNIDEVQALGGGGAEVIFQRSPVLSRRINLDLEAIAAAGMVSPNAPRSRIAEQYRVIKRPLLVNAMGRGTTPPIAKGNLVMVTSALPREGKTFTAMNLALSMATEMDNTVMLVDADVARPSLLQLLGIPPQPGLLDILQNESLDLSDILLRTNIDKLTLLPSGTSHPRATELLASEAMARLLRDMSNRYSDRIIIFDSPPLLVTTESHVLASQMGQVVLVVEAEGTLQGAVMQALAAIEACPVKLVMLNKAKVEFKKGYSYGCDYAFGYG